jgi:hypothetical protein
MVLEHRRGAAADLVDVVDLPGGVMQECDRCLEYEDVVMVGGAAMNAPMSFMVSLSLKPRPPRKNARVTARSVVPNTVWPSLRGWTRPVRSTPGARAPRRSIRPGPL